MIVVIADDFTGAAEIAGLGLQYGLKVTLELEITKDSDVDLLIIVTDTRSMDKEGAYKTMSKLKEKLLGIDYDWLFKKTDSVFRGHILTEIKALMDINKKKQVLLAASNPALGRKIINGQYFINDVLLNETGFADDPEYPIKSANILDLVKNNGSIPVSLLLPGEEISGEGVFLGEAGTIGDLIKLAGQVTDKMIPVGASGFFDALLGVKGFIKKGMPKYEMPSFVEKKYLIVTGSSYSRISSKMPGLDDKKKSFISNMPDDVFYGEDSARKTIEQWSESIIKAYEKYKGVIIEINQPVLRDKAVSERLREQIASLVEKIYKAVNIHEIIIDGGATAYSIVRKLGLLKFYPAHEYAPGVIQMRVKNNDGLFFTIKPGSYKWPEVFEKQF